MRARYFGRQYRNRSKWFCLENCGTVMTSEKYMHQSAEKYRTNKKRIAFKSELAARRENRCERREEN